MDDDLRQAFATLSAQMSDIGTDARHAADQARLAVNATNMLGSRLSGLEADVGQLKTAVYGSNPPPAPVPVVKRITHSEGDIAELSGQVIAVKADIAAVKAINEEQSQKLEKQGQMLLANTTDTIAIRREIVDGVKSFWKKNPKLETALVGLIFAVISGVTTWLTARGH